MALFLGLFYADPETPKWYSRIFFKSLFFIFFYSHTLHWHLSHKAEWPDFVDGRTRGIGLHWIGAERLRFHGSLSTVVSDLSPRVMFPLLPGFIAAGAYLITAAGFTSRFIASCKEFPLFPGFVPPGVFPWSRMHSVFVSSGSFFSIFTVIRLVSGISLRREFTLHSLWWIRRLCYRSRVRIRALRWCRVWF